MRHITGNHGFNPLAGDSMLLGENVGGSEQLKPEELEERICLRS